MQTDGTGFFIVYDGFNFVTSGAYPNGLIQCGGILLGTTTIGGTAGAGTIFSLFTGGGIYSLVQVCSPGLYAGPDDGPVLSGSTLYGTVRTMYNYGDPGYYGAVVSLGVGGCYGGTASTNLCYFKGTDGATPLGGLLLSGNVLYGTTSSGGGVSGGSGEGVVFKINTDGTGFTNLHKFSALTANTNSDGANPQSALLLSGNVLYGTADSGGRWGQGTAFRLNTDGTCFTNLYSFKGPASNTNEDGAPPYSALILSGSLFTERRERRSLRKRHRIRLKSVYCSDYLADPSEWP